MESPCETTLTGQDYKFLVMAAAQNLISQEGHLNRINVYPVPDGDTGANMADTMRGIVRAIGDSSEISLGAVAGKVAEGALINSRGNSGTMLAQFFCGLDESLKNETKLTLLELVPMLKKAFQETCAVVSNPTEGTIITVMRAWVEGMSEKKEELSAVELFEYSLKKAEMALLKTPELLPCLKEANVVDAGAQGFFYLLEGIDLFIKKEEYRESLKKFTYESEEVWEDADIHGTYTSENPYCTECIVENWSGSGVLKESLTEFGDSIVVAGNSRLHKVHIHTSNPEEVFDFLRQNGKLGSEKIDDMRAQEKAALGTQKIGLFVDSSCDLPKEILEKYNIHIIPVRVQFGEESYIDKLGLSPRKFYHMLQNHEHHPKTSLPTLSDYKRSYEFAKRHYEKVLALHLPSKLSGTFQASEHMAKQVLKDYKIIDTCSTSVGLGLLALDAARGIEAGLSFEEICEQVEKNRNKLQFFLSLETMEYLIRGGRVSSIKGAIGRMLGMRPMLTMDREGNIALMGKNFGEKKSREKCFELFKSMVAGKKNVKILLAHGNDEQILNYYLDRIKNELKVDEIITSQLSPALGAHAGPRAMAFGVLGD